MWDRRKEQGPNQPPVNQPTMEPPVHRPAAPAPQFEPPAASGPGARIGRGVTIKGEVYSEEDLYVDGQVEGAVELKDCKLTVGPNGKAFSNIKAREVVVMGSVKGDIDAKAKIIVRKDGSLVGNIRTSGIVIDDDAYFKGSIDIVQSGKKDVKETAA